MTPLERLLAEEIPTGTFGHAIPPTPGPRPWTALEQAEHRRILDEALNGWDYDRNSRHLRLIDGQPDTSTTAA